MKRILLVAAFLVAAISANAQELEIKQDKPVPQNKTVQQQPKAVEQPKVVQQEKTVQQDSKDGAVKPKTKSLYWGVKAGFNFSYLSGASSDFAPGYQVGVFAEYSITPQFAIQPNLLLMSKGGIVPINKPGSFYKPGGVGTAMLYKTYVNTQYVELPLMFVYKITLGSGFLTLNAGPYIATGISGTMSDDFVDLHRNRTSAFSEGQFKSLDYGINGGLGIEFGKTSFSINYEAGLANQTMRVVGLNLPYKPLNPDGTPNNTGVFNNVKNASICANLAFKF